MYLYFNQDWNLTRIEYLPQADNLQPFNVTKAQAKVIAVEAGVPVGLYGVEAWLGYSGDPSDSIGVYANKYVWYVSSWVDPPSSIPRKNIYAVIDPTSGKVYTVLHGGWMGGIGS